MYINTFPHASLAGGGHLAVHCMSISLIFIRPTTLFITMLKQLLSTAKVVLLALVLSFGLSYALAWTAPTATPPGANVAAPINAGNTAQEKTGGLTVGSLTTAGAVTAGSVSAPNVLTTSATAQTKSGGLTVGSLTTTGLTNTGTLRVTSGAGATKVLTSDASGNATWQVPAVGSGDNLGNHTATQALNMAGNSITNAGSITATNRLTVSEANGAYTYITLRDDESPNGVKHVHANSNVVGFLSGAGSWLSYWSNAGDQYLTRNLYANDVYVAGKWMSSLVGTTNVYLCPSRSNDPRCSGPNTCGGNLSLGSTCTFRQDQGSCVGVNLACTYSGKLQP